MHLHHLGDAGPDVVLLHGIPGSARSWAETARLLAERHRVWVPDLLGFGESAGPVDLDAASQAEALDRALSDAHVATASIVGHDFGGPVAMSLYKRRPGLFESLTLMATNAFPDTPIPFPLNAVTWPLIGDAMARVLFSRPSLKAMLWRYGGSELGNVTSVRSIFANSLQNLEALYGDYPEILRSVQVPSLVVWGDRDPFFPAEMATRTADLIGGAEVTLLPGAGHFLPETHPVEVARAVADLTARANTGAG